MFWYTLFLVLGAQVRATVLTEENISYAECDDIKPAVQDRLREELRTGNCIRELEVVSPEQVDRASRLFHRDGFVAVRNALTSSQVERLRNACQKLADEMLARDPKRLGNRGPYRYSFAQASNTGHLLHIPELAGLVDLPTISPILKKIFGNDEFIVRGARGDFNLPGANYQPLHSDAWPAFFESAVPTAWPDSGNLNYRDLPPFYVAVNFFVSNITALNAPIRHVPMTQNSQRPVPSLDDEPLWMKRSTLCPASAGTAIIRDVRAWHGGTPNLSQEIRLLPNIEYYASWFRFKGTTAGSSTQMGVTMPREVYDSLSPFGKKLCREVVAQPGEELDTSMPEEIGNLHSNILLCYKKTGLTDQDIEDFRKKGKIYDYSTETTSTFYKRKIGKQEDGEQQLKDEL